MINKIEETTKHITIDPSVNKILSMIWSSDDTHLAIKTDNQIITIDLESGKQIASLRLTACNFTANSSLTKYITINTAGQLEVFNLFSKIDN